MTGILATLENIVSAAKAVTTQQLGADGQKVVDDAVNAAEALGGTGPQKFSAAVEQAGNDLVALGKDCGLYILHLAIEAAVTALNAPAISAAVAAQPSPPAAGDNSGAASNVPSAVAPTIPAGNQALANAVANVNAGSDVDTEASILVAELAGQSITLTVDQAESAINAAIAEAKANSGAGADATA